MTRLRSTISNCLPRAIVPYGRRIMRRFDQVMGLSSSSKRPGAVLMLHVGRCGSTVLANLLDQNPEIYWDAKLHRKGRELYGDKFKSLDYAKWTKRQFSISGPKYYGFEFKILADQYPAFLGTTTEEFLKQCKLIEVTHYILLVRRNTLRHVVSHYASKNRGNWHISKSDAVKLSHFTLDVDRITTGSAPGRPMLDYLAEVEKAHDEVRSILSASNLLEISYEDDIEEKGADNAYQEVCNFLNMPSVNVEIKNRRVNPFPISESIENYEELVAVLKGTRFEWMLEG